VDTEEPEILLLQITRWPFLGGKWEMTGGGPRERETILRAAEREAEEEADIKVGGFVACVGHHHHHCPWMLWRAHNMKIMFLARVDGDAGLGNIKLNWYEHQAYRWVNEAQLGDMVAHKVKPVKLKMEGREAKPTDKQFPNMQYVSAKGKILSLEANK
jgi:8-oxo-dGTP pyrophosphatase MutT (NUDIX family)